MVSPVKIKSDGKIGKVLDKTVSLSTQESYIVSGDILAYGGIRLNPQFSGTGFSAETRILGDFGSRMYHICRVEKETPEKGK